MARFAQRLLVSVLPAAPLIAVSYAGWKLAGLLFFPFRLFDALVNVLPGRILVTGVETVSSTVRGLGARDTSTAAKTLEVGLAVAISFIAVWGVGLAAVFAMSALRRRRYAIGLAAGAIAGSLFVWAGSGRAASAQTDYPWTLGCFLLWGAALAWLQSRQTETPAADAPSTGTGQLSRRHLIWTATGASAAITTAGVIAGRLASASSNPLSAGRWSATHLLPNAGADVQVVRGGRPEFTPLEKHYRIDIDTVPPHVREQEWTLRIGGLVEQPARMKLGELRERYEPMHQFITLACISNSIGGDLIGTTRWTGVGMQRLLADLRLKPSATHLKIRSADGFYEVVSLKRILEDQRVMLAYAWDGLPLMPRHGFPLRIYIPNVYGMKQPKWIESIEAIDHWEPGYWVARGWDKHARMKTTSVIDAIGPVSSQGGDSVLPIGGFAHAGSRGVSRVEVQADGGSWNPARLREPLSGLTWRFWRYDWPLVPGKHTFTVRCTDGNGDRQPERAADPYPDGAAGLDSRTVTI
jgi:DMSO/TMAO reductase YedYZ molybdopterin-dependent catalytic subunit